jgi:hypothetical protein
VKNKVESARKAFQTALSAGQFDRFGSCVNLR